MRVGSSTNFRSLTDWKVEEQVFIQREHQRKKKAALGGLGVGDQLPQLHLLDPVCQEVSDLSASVKEHPHKCRNSSPRKHCTVDVINVIHLICQRV